MGRAQHPEAWQDGRSRLARCDFTEIGGLYDVILSNPPYIRTQDIPALAPEVRLHEPVQALDGGADGLDAYRVLAPEIERLLKPEGLAFLEIGAGRARRSKTDENGRHRAGLGRDRSLRDRAKILTLREKTVELQPRNR